MKPQDIAFFIILGILIWRADNRALVLAGLICLVLAVPLFAGWIFFTAERLTWYAAAFFLTAIIRQLVFVKKEYK